MKKLSLIMAIPFIMANTVNAQIAEGYEVATWHNFSKAAITYSFDDGTPNQIPVAIPLLNKYGFHGTFNLITSWVKDWSEWRKVGAMGHEIASHTVTHANFGQTPDNKQEEELAESKKIIEREIGKECITMVYPYCVTGNDKIVARHYISARGCSGQIGAPTPENMFNITSRVVGTESDMQTADNFNKWVASAIGTKGWCVFLIHALDDDGGYSPIKSTEFESHLKYVKQSGLAYWVGTFAEISKYIIERNSLTISEQQEMDYVEITVGCTAKSSLTKFDQPVTIKRKLPEGCTTARIVRNNSEIPSLIADGCIIFDVVPDEVYVLSF